MYNNSAIQALQVVLKVATGVEPADYAQQRLFGPLGMDDTTWDRDVAGHTTMYAGINSTCRTWPVRSRCPPRALEEPADRPR